MRGLLLAKAIGAAPLGLHAVARARSIPVRIRRLAAVGRSRQGLNRLSCSENRVSLHVDGIPQPWNSCRPGLSIYVVLCGGPRGGKIVIETYVLSGSSVSATRCASSALSSADEPTSAVSRYVPGIFAMLDVERVDTRAAHQLPGIAVDYRHSKRLPFHW